MEPDDIDDEPRDEIERVLAEAGERQRQIPVVVPMFVPRPDQPLSCAARKVQREWEVSLGRCGRVRTRAPGKGLCQRRPADPATG